MKSNEATRIDNGLDFGDKVARLFMTACLGTVAFFLPVAFCAWAYGKDHGWSDDLILFVSFMISLILALAIFSMWLRSYERSRKRGGS